MSSTIKRYSSSMGLNPNSFVALVVPVDSNYFLLVNAGSDALFLRSNAADSTTEHVAIQPGGWKDSLVPQTQSGYRADANGAGSIYLAQQFRYPAGTTIYFAKATGDIVGEFWP